jgi:hypothetical protein
MNGKKRAAGRISRLTAADVSISNAALAAAEPISATKAWAPLNQACYTVEECKLSIILNLIS